MIEIVVRAKHLLSRDRVAERLTAPSVPGGLRGEGEAPDPEAEIEHDEEGDGHPEGQRQRDLGIVGDDVSDLMSW